MTALKKVSNVRPPWVAEDSWFDAVTATPDTIRAALFTGETARIEKRFTNILLANGYGSAMVVVGWKQGWSIDIAPSDSHYNLCAVHKGSKLQGKRVKRGRWWSFKPPGEYFTLEQTEKVMIEFLEMPSNPPSVAWVDLEPRRSCREAAFYARNAIA